MEEKLKPCPFCGGVPEKLTSDAAFVYCTKCGARVLKYPSIELAVAHWNNRVTNNKKGRSQNRKEGHNEAN